MLLFLDLERKLARFDRKGGLRVSNLKFVDVFMLKKKSWG
jgi:hypothetical protein